MDSRVVRPQHRLVENLDEIQDDSILDFEGVQLDGDHGNRACEEGEGIQESAGDVVGHDHGAVVVGRVAAALDVLILDGPQDVALVAGSDL